MSYENWNQHRLGDFVEVQNGYAFKARDFAISGIPVIKIKNVSSPQVNLEDAQYYNAEISERLKQFLIYNDDILISMTGSHVNQFASAVGKIGKYKYDFPALLNQRVGKVYIKNTHIGDHNFLYYFLNRYEIQYELASSAGGSANQANISPSQIKDLQIRLPPLPVQRRIAAILSSLDDKIELHRQTNQTLQAIAQAIFKEWFVDFNVPGATGEMKDTELEQIPKGWRNGSLKEVLDIEMGQSPLGSSYNQKTEGMIFFQGKAEFGFRFPVVDKYTTAPKRYANKFDTLLSVRAPVGALNMAGDRCCIGRGLAALRGKNNEMSFTYYLLNSLQSEFAKYEGSGTVFGSINKAELGNTQIVIPSDDIIMEFEEKVNLIDELIFNNEQQIQTLTQLRDTLLPKLMKGEIPIPEV